MTDDSKPVYLIFGASGGIGSALCRRLAAGGARLAIAARGAERLQELAREVDADPIILDATRPSEVDACVPGVVERYGRLDGVAHCVGSLFLKPAHLTSDDEWHSALAVNLTSAFSVVRASTRAMLKTGGSIVLVSSAAARAGVPTHEAIAAAKAGLIGLVLSAAATYAAQGIRVNAVAPGLVRTPLTESLTKSELALKASTSLHPLGRIGEPDDVASAIAWLLDPGQGWVTGQVLGVDGGLADLRTKARS